jgi:uncharacterized protein
MQGDQSTPTYIELLLLRDAPFVESATAQGLAFGAFERRRASEFDYVSHDWTLPGGRSKVAHLLAVRLRVTACARRAHGMTRPVGGFNIRTLCTKKGEPVQLADAEYFNLATFRRNGIAVATPVWFALMDDTFYVFSAPDTGKIKRLRLSSRARVAACDIRGKVLGEWLDAKARLVAEPAEIDRAYAALRRKYGFRIAALDFFAKLTGRYHRRQFIAVTVAAP